MFSDIILPYIFFLDLLKQMPFIKQFALLTCQCNDLFCGAQQSIFLIIINVNNKRLQAIHCLAKVLETHGQLETNL